MGGAGLAGLVAALVHYFTDPREKEIVHQISDKELRRIERRMVMLDSQVEILTEENDRLEEIIRRR